MKPPVPSMLLEIGFLGIHWYGLLIVIGILLGAHVAAYLARQAQRDAEHVWDMLLIAVLFGVIGARLYHVVSQPSGGMLGWSHYKANPIEILYIWQGGLGIYGAIIGGTLGVLLYTWLTKLPPLEWLDYAAPGMAIGQSIGRWGNFINQELYGPPTTLPWGLDIPFLHRIPPYHNLTLYPLSTRFHPTFLYESLAAFALCLLLIWISVRYREQLRPGDVLVGYLMGYGLIRFFIEYLRPDAWMLGALAAAQVFALVLVFGGLLFLVTRRKLAPQT